MVNPDKLFGRLSNRMFQMAALYAYCKDNGYPIFVQDEKYFKRYEKEIRQLYGDGIDQRNKGYVGIHVRRAKNPVNPGELAYSENPFYANLMHHLHEDMSDNYYVQAMNYFRVSIPDIGIVLGQRSFYKFKVFSDDIEWCKQQKIFEGCEFVEGGTEISDMNEMASCEHNIIANSSFSWWAAFLNKNPNKIIIAPKKWFANPEHDKQFIGLPSDWIRI